MTKESWYKEILYAVIKQNITHSDQKLYLKSLGIQYFTSSYYNINSHSLADGITLNSSMIWTYQHYEHPVTWTVQSNMVAGMECLNAKLLNELQSF